MKLILNGIHYAERSILTNLHDIYAYTEKALVYHLNICNPVNSSLLLKCFPVSEGSFRFCRIFSWKILLICFNLFFWYASPFEPSKLTKDLAIMDNKDLSSTGSQ